MELNMSERETEVKHVNDDSQQVFTEHGEYFITQSRG